MLVAATLRNVGAAVALSTASSSLRPVTSSDLAAGYRG